MSFSNDIAPRSTLIKEDFLLSYQNLAQIKSNLKTCKEGDEKFAKIIPKLKTVIESFNINVKFINKQIEPLEFTDFQTFENYCSDKGLAPDADALTSYDHEKASFEQVQYQEVTEQCQLKQLARIGHHLILQITTVYNKLDKFDSLAKHKSSCNLEIPDLTLCQFLKPKLRITEEGASAVQTTPSSSVTIEAEDTTAQPSSANDGAILGSTTPPGLSTPEVAVIDPSPTLTAPEEIVETPVETTPDASTVGEPTPSIATTIDVMVMCTLGSEQTLGICCEPNWGAAPIACAKDGKNGWSAQAPLNKEWKWVVLQNGQVQRWESGANRRYDAPTASPRLYPRF